MFFSIKYKENEEKYIKLFGNIKEKCYFCSRVEILQVETRNLSTPCSLYNKGETGSERTKVSNI